MSPDDAPALPETLLAHTGWMRRLARTLVRDDAQADDVVQDAVVAALRSPPRDPLALPAWLATSVRNGARQLWRGESRRAARETAAARTGTSPDAAEVVARAEEHGLVVQAVLALEEPYRSALLLRFYDDLPPRDVAARLGVPVETARARIRRGVEHLRARLDRAHGGDGSAWRLALVPLTFHHGSAALTGSSSGAAAGSNLTTGAMVMAGSGTAAAVGGLALVIGIAGGWWLGATKSDEIAAQHLETIQKAKKEMETAQAHATGADARAEKHAAQIAQLQDQCRAAQKDFADAQKKIEELTAALEQMKSPAAPAAAAPAAKGPRFAFGQYDKLSQVDWKAVGEHLSAMAPLCDEIVAAMAKGEDAMPAIGKTQQHNGFLINAALKIAGQVPGTGVNGAFTHPAFQANAIASALEAAGKPLTPEQATALEKLAREASDEDAQRLLAYTEDTYGMRKILDEADLRRRFFDGAFRALSEDQRNTLTPPATKGFVGLDLYSEGLLYATVMRPIQFKDPAALVDSVTNALQGGMKIPKEQAESLRAVVTAWQRDLPSALIDPAEDEKIGPGRVRVDIVRLAATKTLSLAESIVTELKLEGTAAAAARRWQLTLLPIHGDE